MPELNLLANVTSAHTKRMPLMQDERAVDVLSASWTPLTIRSYQQP